MPIPDLENPLFVPPDLPTPALDGFHTPVREWFRETFPSPTRPQALGWPLLQTGASSLILSPTGSGKTLTAFLSAIDRLMFEPVPPKARRCRVLYISPIKALAVDVERNLRAPLAGVARTAERMGIAYHTPEVAIRTGDTPSRDRAYRPLITGRCAHIPFKPNHRAVVVRNSQIARVTEVTVLLARRTR